MGNLKAYRFIDIVHSISTKTLLVSPNQYFSCTKISLQLQYKIFLFFPTPPPLLPFLYPLRYYQETPLQVYPFQSLFVPSSIFSLHNSCLLTSTHCILHNLKISAPSNITNRFQIKSNY